MGSHFQADSLCLGSELRGQRKRECLKPPQIKEELKAHGSSAGTKHSRLVSIQQGQEDQGCDRGKYKLSESCSPVAADIVDDRKTG